jgi:hypothetical protein
MADNSTNDAIIYYLDANVQKISDKLDKSVSDLKKYTKTHQDEHDKIQGIWGKTDIGEAIGNIFKGVKTDALEEGAKNLGVLGKGLEALGPAGIVAAAGIAAFGLSLEQAKQAAEFGEQLQVNADKLGITTDKLQEYNFVALSSGLASDAFASAIEGGNAALGKFKSNINAGRVKKIFAELGITKEDADKANSIVDLLPQIADKIKNFSVATQTQVAKGLGLEAILPVLQKGGEELQNLQAEAHTAGAVLDEALVQKAAQGADELKKAGAVINTQLHAAFVGLIPVLVQITQFMSNMVTLASNIAQKLGYAFSGDATNLSDQNLNAQTKNVADERTRLFARVKDIDPNASIDGHNRIQSGKLDSITSAQGINQLKAAIKANAQEWLDLGKEVNRRTKITADANAKASASGKTDPAAAPDKTKKAPSDQTAALNEAAKSIDDSAQKAVDSAYDKLATTIEAHAEAQHQIVADELKESEDRITKQRAAITKAVGKGEESATAAKAQNLLLDEASARLQLVATLKNELITRNTLIDILKQDQELSDSQAQVRQAGYRREANYYAALGSLATTTQARVAYENQAFASAQAADRDIADQQVKDAQSGVNQARIGGDATKLTEALNKLTTALEDRKSLDTIQPIQAQARSQEQFRSANPLYAYANPTESIDQSLQSVGVKGLQSLSSGIASAIVNAKNLGEVFHNVSKQIIEDLLQIGIQRAIVDPLANLLFGGQATAVQSSATPSGGLFGGIFHGLGIPGFALGTGSAPGGLSWVGEAGPELVNLPRGSQVIPSAQSLALTQGGGTPVQNINLATTTVVNADQSVLTGQIQTWIAVAHQSAIEGGAKKAAQQLSGANRNNFIRS